MQTNLARTEPSHAAEGEWLPPAGQRAGNILHDLLALECEDAAGQAAARARLQRLLAPVRYPNITVALIAHDGNAFVVLARVANALKRAGVDECEIDEFLHDATGRDLNHLLRTALAWVSVQ